MMDHSDSSGLEMLSGKINELLDCLSKFGDVNRRLKEELVNIKENNRKEYLYRVANLEEDIRKLKKENKTLKEREKLIKNKTERLAVKLEKIDI